MPLTRQGQSAIAVSPTSLDSVRHVRQSYGDFRIFSSRLAWWALPRLPSTDNAALKAVSLIANDWQLSGIWTGRSGTAYTVTQQYQTGNANVNLTGSPDFAPRILVVGDPGKDAAVTSTVSSTRPPSRDRR
jgi:hypothetical protein